MSLIIIKMRSLDETLQTVHEQHSEKRDAGLQIHSTSRPVWTVFALVGESVSSERTDSPAVRGPPLSIRGVIP